LEVVAGAPVVPVGATVVGIEATELDVDPTPADAPIPVPPIPAVTEMMPGMPTEMPIPPAAFVVVDVTKPDGAETPTDRLVGTATTDEGRVALAETDADTDAEGKAQTPCLQT